MGRKSIFLFLLLLVKVNSRHIRESRRLEEEPFDVNNDLFSHLLSLVPPDSNEMEDLKVTTSRRFTGPMTLVTVLPPGYSPMPPGFNNEEEREILLNKENLPENIFEARDIENFHIAEDDSNKEDSHDKGDEEMAREERKFGTDITASSSELEIFPTTGAYDNDEASLFLEGSGLSEVFEQKALKERNITSQEGSGKPQDSREEVAFLLGLPKMKVSGEVGKEEDYRKWKRKYKKTVSVDTFLLNSPLVGVENEADNRTEPLRGAVEGCPSPELCAVNCFVTISPKGCQICQCLWQALTCEKDTDCPESSQHCDLGKCDCADGFVQDMTRSGMCKVADEGLSLNSLGVEKQAEYEKTTKRDRRGVVSFGEKPRSAERLQWPGTCDTNNHCPPPLFCIGGDCWLIPSGKPGRPARRKRLRDSVPDSFLISSDSEDNWEREPETQSKLFQSTRSRALARFVGKSDPRVNREMLERTTVASVEEEPNALFELQKSLIAAEEPHLTSPMMEPTTTANWLYLFSPEDASPPAPPPDSFEETSTKSWPQMSPDSLAKAFTKMIELPTEQVLKPKPRQERKGELRRRPQTSTVATTTLDPIEFPISSQLDSLQRDGIRVEAPLALSATPTAEEEESHNQFIRALEEQKGRIQGRYSPVPFQSSSLPPVFPTLNTQEAFDFSNLADDQALTPDRDQKPGVWYTMKQRAEVERRRSPPRRTLPSFAPGISPRRPVKINGLVGGHLDDECSNDKQCGRFRCCMKRWCDDGNFCSTAKFCLPSCGTTKIVNRRAGALDLVDD